MKKCLEMGINHEFDTKHLEKNMISKHEKKEILIQRLMHGEMFARTRKIQSPLLILKELNVGSSINLSPKSIFSIDYTKYH